MKFSFAANARQRSFEADTLDLIARMTTAPTLTRKIHIDTLIKALKAAGVWAKFDVFVVDAAADSQASLLNWKGDFCNPSLPGTPPTFTADQGWAGSGTLQYRMSNFIPATHGVNYQLNSAYIGYWSRTSAAQGSGGCMIGGRGASTAQTVFLHPRRGGGSEFTVGLNSVDNAGVSNADGSGYYGANRSAADAVQGYRNQVAAITATTASGSLSTAELYLHAQNANGTAVNPAVAQMAAYCFGGPLISTEHNAVEAALRAYMVAVGAA